MCSRKSPASRPPSTAPNSQPDAGAPPTAARRPELLAPAGDWASAKAAVENGADAIYFGLESFNARLRARNFTETDLPGLMAFLHRRGVRGYACLNTLVFTDELAEAERQLRSMIAAGVDAVLVQDVGVCRLVRALSPDFPIHASTQMTITSPAGVTFARELGASLVVLARECSLRDLERIRTAPEALDMPLEVFVHGALCVAYSGQCLTSEALGGRSANRGECAQACRLPYELVADGQTVPLGDRRYLLSPQDLATLSLLPELLALDLASLKIEGRLKSPEYVANITRLYRQAIDALANPNAKATPIPPDARSRYDMEMAFSRGLHTGWLRGLNHQHLVHGRFGKKRGVFLGEVARVGRSRVFMRLRGPLKPGDGVVFDAGRPDQDEEGGRVYALEQAGDTAVLAFRRGGLDLTRVRAGHKVWKTSDQELDRRLRQSYAGQLPHFQRPIHLRVQGNAGEPLRLRAQDEEGRSAEVTSAVPLAPATRHPLTTERLAGHLGRLGGTPFRLGRLENRLADDVILPLSELNRLRRETVKQLDIVRARPPAWTVKPMPPGTAAWRALLEEARNPAPASAPAATARPQLAVLVRTPDQLEAVLATAVPRIYCDFDDPKRYREAVARGRADRHTTSESSTEKSPAATRPVVQTPEVFVAPPRIAKPGEDWMLRQVRASEADGYLVRNYDHLAFFAGARCVGDYSLNIANPLAAACFLRRFSLERVTASYDLNNRQLEALLTSAPPAWFEITVHQHVPMFHMDHCLWCAFLTAATDHTNCGRPCDRVAVKLRDRTGAEHPVRADAGCRNTVFNARAHTGAEHVARLLVLGARHFRLEFLDEPPALVVQTIEAYRRLLRHAWGHISTFDNWSAAEFCGAPLPAGSKPPAPG